MMGDVVSWIQEPEKPWVGNKEFGDPKFTKDCHHLLRSMHTGFVKRLDVQRIAVPVDKRRQGIATNMLDIIEKTAKECGIQYILIEEVCSDAMKTLINKRGGYECVDDSAEMPDYIKRL
jgi:N-acetylglutamate synthase-like GNAT family acetyltransferase